MEEQSLSTLAREALLVVIRQRRVILAVYLGVLVAAIAGIFLATPQYRAASKILLTSDRAQISTSSDRPTELTRSNLVLDGELSSQLEILHSREIVETVLQQMHKAAGIDDSQLVAPPPATAWLNPFEWLRLAYHRVHKVQDVKPTSPLYWQAVTVMAGLEANRVRASNVIEIAMTSPNPAWGREFVERLTNAYLERHAQLQQVQQAEDFFNSQSQLLQNKLADSEAALRASREHAGALAGQQTEVHNRLNEFSAELSRTKIGRAELEERVAYLESLQNNAAKRGRVATPQLLELEGKRAELLGRYRPESEKVKEIDEQIARLRTAVASYDSIVTSGGEGNAQGGAAATDLVSARAALAALKGKEDALAKQEAEYRSKAEMLDAQSFDLARLERQAKLDEETYTSYVRTAEQSRLSNALEQSKILRLSVVEPASVSMEPVSPRKGRILTFAFLGGLAVSVGAGFARDRLNTTLKTASDVRRYGKVDVLAAVPDRL